MGTHWFKTLKYHRKFNARKLVRLPARLDLFLSFYPETLLFLIYISICKRSPEQNDCYTHKDS